MTRLSGPDETGDLSGEQHRGTDAPQIPASAAIAVGRVWIARGCSSVVEPLPSKQAAWVRFPSPALGRSDETAIDGSRGLRTWERIEQSERVKTFNIMLPWLSW